MALMRLIGTLCLLFLVVGRVYPQQQTYDETDDETVVESDEGEKIQEGEETDETAAVGKASPFADIASHVVQLEGGALPSNEIITVLVGFQNTGKSEFTVDVIEGSFRYPQDYNYHIQNFTYFRYNRVVPAGEEVSMLYRFFVHESFHSRSLGLSVNVHYHDKEGKLFESAAFNETVRIAEPLEGFDAETFFLYVLLLAVIALVGFGGYQLFRTYKKKLVSSKPGSSPAFETGTQKASDVDTDWLPKELLAQEMRNKQGKTSPSKSKNSPNGGNAASSDSENDARLRKVRPAGTKMAD